MAKSLYRAEHLALAALLRQAREQSGLVQAALAERLGRNQSYVSSVELGIRRLDVVELRDYCFGLSLDLGELVTHWEAQIGKKAKVKARHKK